MAEDAEQSLPRQNWAPARVTSKLETHFLPTYWPSLAGLFPSREVSCGCEFFPQHLSTMCRYGTSG